MSAKTNYLEDALINHILRNSAYSSPATVYAALFTAAPGEAGGGTEVVGGSYARQAVAFDAPSDGVTQNTSDVTFPTATGAWGTVTHFALFDAVSAGNMLYYGTLAYSKDIQNGDIFEFSAGNLVVQEQ